MDQEKQTHITARGRHPWCDIGTTSLRSAGTTTFKQQYLFSSFRETICGNDAARTSANDDVIVRDSLVRQLSFEVYVQKGHIPVS